jgi:hypothetical protein
LILVDDAGTTLLSGSVTLDTTMAAGNDGYQKDLSLTATTSNLALVNGDAVRVGVVATGAQASNACQGGVLTVGYTNY